MAQKLININISNRNCKGLYFVDSNGTYDGVKEITNDNAPKKSKEGLKLVLRLKKNNRTTKKTFTYSNHITFLQAIDDVTEQRSTVFEVKERSSKIPTLGEYWLDYIEWKKNFVTGKKSWKTSTAKDMEAFYSKWIAGIDASEKRRIQKENKSEIELAKKEKRKPASPKVYRPKPYKIHNMLVTEITEDDVQALINKIEKNTSRRTAKKVTEALAPLFKRYYKANHIKGDNPADIDVGELNNEREVLFTLSEAKDLYDAMFNYPIEKYRNVFVWLATGRRLGEVLSLDISAINIKKKQFDIIGENSKSEKKLTFVLRPELEETLEGKDGLIHPSDKNTIMDGSTIRSHWHKVLSTAELEGLHMHDIRHIIGSVLRDSGVGEDIRALVLGHTRSSVTARYATANAELADEVYQFFLDKIEGKIEPKTKWVEV